MATTSAFKRPESVLVVVHTRDGRVLLLKRADRADFWQSVTGAMNDDERDPRQAAARELSEETGLRVAPEALRDLDLTQRFSIYPEWRHRYAQGVSENVERAFAFELPSEAPIAIDREHETYGWFSFDEALQKIASWSNRQALRAAFGRRELVVLVHGLWLKGWCMNLLGRRLRRAGFDTCSFSYHTVRADLRENATRLEEMIAPLPHDVVHFVGHSLGGLVIRALMNYFPHQRPGRIVTLASPHQGSAVARAFAGHALGGAILGKCMRDLADGALRDWPLPPRDIGVVSGTLPIGFGRLFARFDGPHDGTVSVRETVLPGAREQLAAKVTHMGMLLSDRVANATIRFLCQGRFE